MTQSQEKQSQEKQTGEAPVAIDTLIVVAIAASALSAAFLCEAVLVDAGDIGRSVIALIAAGMAAGIAVVGIWASGRGAERRNARRHQLAMFASMSGLYESALSKRENTNDNQATLPELPELVAQSLNLIKQPPQAATNHAKLTSQPVELYPKLVSEWLECNKQLGKEVEASHTRLVSEWLESMREIASPPGSGPK